MDQGAPALTIDQVPLQRCFQNGVVLDFSHKPDGARITAGDVQKELDRIGYRLKPLDIVLVRTGADAFWGHTWSKGPAWPGSPPCTCWIRASVGIDAWSWDRPLPFLAKEFQETGDAAVIWEAHFAGIEHGYCHMEKLARLDRIPSPHGFKVACFPIKIKRASAGWTRPVAIIEE